MDPLPNHPFLFKSLGTAKNKVDKSTDKNSKPNNNQSHHGHPDCFAYILLLGLNKAEF
jgi:hypothetical protein